MSTGLPISASMLYLLLQKKKCRDCGRLTHKDVLFCWFCGSSFEYRICVSGHKNPAWAQFCRTCGKDRSLMSRPHGSHDLSFVKHSTKPSTWVPGRQRFHHTLAWLAIGLGIAIICCIAFVLSYGR